MKSFQSDAVDFFVRFYGPSMRTMRFDDPRLTADFIENLYLRYLTDDDFRAEFLATEAIRAELEATQREIRSALRAVLFPNEAP